ncbi:restriction endonuclease subunit S [Lewinella sp. IMCC34183]|uniref:restriction endonuclease subunit S n=1 Tax=Lewinella sp. IMCC34183 TaxID=2248762 RepID=UPI000E25CFE7|nr:restriction endonuclease subunit S [Lewinella sp. IMCC34183]
MREVKLGDYITLAGGGTPSKKNLKYWNGSIPWASVKDLKEDLLTSTVDSITEEGLANCPSSLIKAGTVVVCTRMAVGKAVITAIDTAINQDLKAVYTSKELDKKFLFYLFKANEDYFNSVATGATVQGIKIEHLKGLRFVLPPLPTQRRIAAALDLADRQRQLLREEIAAYGQLGESLFLEMFGDPVGNNKNFPVCKLLSASEQITDGTHHSPEPKEFGRPYVTAKHIKLHGLDFKAKPSFISEEAHREIIKRCCPVKGDVLYIKDGATTGIACINTFEESISLLSSVALIKLNKDKLNGNYLVALLNNLNMQMSLQDKYMSGAAIKRYTIAKIKRFEIPLPPIASQDQFANRIQKIEALKAKAEAALAEADDLFNALLQRAFRGELFGEGDKGIRG